MTRLPPAATAPVAVVADVLLAQADTSSLLRVLGVLHGRHVDVMRFVFDREEAYRRNTARLVLVLPPVRWRHVRAALERVVEVIDVVEVGGCTDEAFSSGEVAGSSARVRRSRRSS